MKIDEAVKMKMPLLQAIALLSGALEECENHEQTVLYPFSTLAVRTLLAGYDKAVRDISEVAYHEGVMPCIVCKKQGADIFQCAGCSKITSQFEHQGPNPDSEVKP